MQSIMDIIVGGGIGYVTYSLMQNGEIAVKASDIKQSSLTDGRVFANKLEILKEKQIRANIGEDDLSTTEAIIDKKLQNVAFRDMRRLDLRASESGVARTAGQKLLWRNNWKYPRSMMGFPEPEDAQ